MSRSGKNAAVARLKAAKASAMRISGDLKADAIRAKNAEAEARADAAKAREDLAALQTKTSSYMEAADEAIRDLSARIQVLTDVNTVLGEAATRARSLLLGRMIRLVPVQPTKVDDLEAVASDGGVRLEAIQIAEAAFVLLLSEHGLTEDRAQALGRILELYGADHGVGILPLFSRGGAAALAYRIEFDEPAPDAAALDQQITAADVSPTGPTEPPAEVVPPAL